MALVVLRPNLPQGSGILEWLQLDGASGPVALMSARIELCSFNKCAPDAGNGRHSAGFSGTQALDSIVLQVRSPPEQPERHQLAGYASTALNVEITVVGYAAAVSDRADISHGFRARDFSASSTDSVSRERFGL
jgi:hypothetical protein